MKKSVTALLVISICLILSISLVSAGFWSNFFAKITGKAIAENSLVAYYKFDGNANDEQGNYPGAVSGASLTTGVSGQAYEFSLYDYISTSISDTFTDELTFSAWVRPDSKSDERPTIMGFDRTGYKKSLWIDNNNQFAMEVPINGVRCSARTPMTYGQLYHVAGTAKASTGEVKIYINGDLKATSNCSSGSMNTKYPLKIGYYGSLGKFKGMIDEVKIWNYALSAAEVASEYNSVASTNETNVTATCTDSDGGKDYYAKGIASKPGWSDIEDFCVNSTKLSEALCNNDGNPAYAQYDCPNGCEDGACVASTNATNVTCTDTDGGKNYYVKGETTGLAYPNNETVTLIDHCFNNTYLNEGGCGEDGYTGWDLYNCPNGCSNGTCIIPTNATLTCIDSDGGLDYYAKGTCIDSLGGSFTDSCNPNVWGRINEAFCENNKCNFVAYDDACPNGCEGGACIVSANQSFSFCSNNVCTIHNGQSTPTVFNGTAYMIESTVSAYNAVQLTINNITTNKLNEGDTYPIDEILKIKIDDIVFQDFAGGEMYVIISLKEAETQSCTPISLRKEEKYCSINETWLDQKTEGSVCENNFECKSNLCIDGECMSGSLIRRIIEWFKRVFGGG